jgi:short-subunit dehydrogenase
MAGRPSPRVIAITGASGGIGQALAACYAAPGRHLLLCGRDATRLAAAAQAATAAGARVDLLTTSLATPEAFAADLAAFDARVPVDLLIVGAGVKTGNIGGIEDPVQMQRVVAVNLTGAMLSVQAVLPAMRRRGAGRIALIASLAARSPHADLLSYSATKAAVEAYAVALRRSLHGSGVGVSLVLPGFVDTPMTDRHEGATPFLIPAADAALRIRRGLEAGRRTIAFPRRLALLIALRNAVLPAALSDRIETRLRARVLPDDDERAASGR